MSDSDEMKLLREENEGLRKELHEATLQLATAAHKEYQIPDSNIKEDYEKICQAIERWIDYASDDDPGDFKARYNEALRREEKSRRLKDLGLVYERTATMDPSLNWLGGLNVLHYYILSLVFRQFIFFWIMMKRYPVGTTESQQVAFSSIEEEMIRMGKTKSKTNQWRADTLAALSASKAFKAEQNKILDELWDDLRDDLSFWIRKSEVSKHRARLRREIFDPAVKLHQEMQCSTQEFEFVHVPKGVHFDFTLRENQSLPYNLKDITTWKTMTSDGTESQNIFDCIYPGIIVYDQEAEGKLELVKPVIVVYKPPLTPPKKRSTTSSASSSPPRSGSPVKESREPKNQRAANNTLVKFSSDSSFFSGVARAFGGGGRKTIDSPRQPELSPRTSRRPSHPPSRLVGYLSLNQEQYQPQPVQTYTSFKISPPEPHKPGASPSYSYATISAEGQSSSGNIVMECEESDEMSYTSSSPRR